MVRRQYFDTKLRQLLDPRITGRRIRKAFILKSRDFCEGFSSLAQDHGEQPTSAQMATLANKKCDALPWISEGLPRPAHPSIVSVEGLANRMREKVREYTGGILPSRMKLVGVLAEGQSQNVDAETYASRIAETLAEDGIDFELSRCSNQNPEMVESTIRAVNVRPDVHGILVFYPIFKQAAGMQSQSGSEAHRGSTTKAPYLNEVTGVYYKSHDDYLRDVVDPTKDVEGLSTSSTARWIFQARAPRDDRMAPPVAGREEPNATAHLNVDFYIPCTALAVLKVLEAYHCDQAPATTSLSPQHTSQRWSSGTVTVVNRSEIFGRPLAAVLALQGATVFSVDDQSILAFSEGGRSVVRRRREGLWTLESCLRRSSVVVTGVPCPDFALAVDAIAPGTLVVNVSEFSNVDEAELLRSCPGVRLVPHIGKVTVAALEQNLVRLHQQRRTSRYGAAEQ